LGTRTPREGLKWKSFLLLGKKIVTESPTRLGARPKKQNSITIAIALLQKITLFLRFKLKIIILISILVGVS